MPKRKLTTTRKSTTDKSTSKSSSKSTSKSSNKSTTNKKLKKATPTQTLQVTEEHHDSIYQLLEKTHEYINVKREHEKLCDDLYDEYVDALKNKSIPLSQEDFAEFIHEYYTLDKKQDERKQLITKLVEDSKVKDKFHDRILDLNVDYKRKSIIYNTYLKWKEDNMQDLKLNTWLENALSLPLTEKKLNIEVNNDLKVDVNWGLQHQLEIVGRSLDSQIHGLKREKKEILAHIYSWYLDNRASEVKNKKGLHFGLIGQPSSSRLELFKALATSLGVPLIIIDKSTLIYKNTPELFSQGIIATKCLNPIFYIDGMAKGTKLETSSIQATNPTQAKEFVDEYFGKLTVDLSQAWFVFSMNTADDFSQELNNRLNLVKFSAHDFENKIKIVKDYIIPKVFKPFSFKCVADDIAVTTLVEKFKTLEDISLRLQSIAKHMNLTCLINKLDQKAQPTELNLNKYLNGDLANTQDDDEEVYMSLYV